MGANRASEKSFNDSTLPRLRGEGFRDSCSSILSWCGLAGDYRADERMQARGAVRVGGLRLFPPPARFLRIGELSCTQVKNFKKRRITHDTKIGWNR
jgi:hypothetical protein